PKIIGAKVGEDENCGDRSHDNKRPMKTSVGEQVTASHWARKSSMSPSKAAAVVGPKSGRHRRRRRKITHSHRVKGVYRRANSDGRESPTCRAKIHSRKKTSAASRDRRW